MTGNPSAPAPTPPLTTVTQAINDLQAAEAATWVRRSSPDGPRDGAIRLLDARSTAAAAEIFGDIVEKELETA
jgi:hypothetical protein